MFLRLGPSKFASRGATCTVVPMNVFTAFWRQKQGLWARRRLIAVRYTQFMTAIGTRQKPLAQVQSPTLLCSKLSISISAQCKMWRAFRAARQARDRYHSSTGCLLQNITKSKSPSSPLAIPLLAVPGVLSYPTDLHLLPQLIIPRQTRKPLVVA